MLNFFGGKNSELSGMVQSLLKEAGGLQGVKAKLESAGLGSAVNSWIGTGENETVDGNQLADALGRDKLEGVAAQKGLDVKKIIPLVAMFLPQIIDKLTPDGDEAAGEAKLNDAKGLDGIVRDVLKGGLGKLFG